MQPTQDFLSTPRRPLDVEDYIDIVRRHKGWIIGPAFAGLVIAVIAAFLWPNTYVSEAVIQVKPSLVPERYVPTNINMEMSQRIASMIPQVTSVEKLTDLIKTENLYPKEHASRPMIDIAEDMRKAVKISPVQMMLVQGGRSPIPVFRVSFEYSDPRKAQRVVSALVDSFYREDLRSRQTQSNTTTEFLEQQWQESKKQMDEIEARLTQFRLRNAGKLPDQLDSNLQTLRSLETQLSGVNEAISRIGQEKLLLDSQARIYRDQMRSVGTATEQLGAAAKSERLVQVERDILNMEATLSGLRERYTSNHPDIRALESQIAVLRRSRDNLMKEEANRPETKTKRAPSPNEMMQTRELEAQIARVQSQIEAKDMELTDRSKDQQKLRDAINAYHSRIQASPIMQEDYAKLMRDYNLARDRYQELNQKLTQSQTATQLQLQERGENLEVVDRASLPMTPSKPNRIVIIAVGLGLGLMLGVFVAGGREVKDSSLKNLKDARAYTNLPVLGTVPLLENDLVVRRKRRMAWLAWSTACILGIAAMSASILFYYSNLSRPQGG